MLGTQLWVLRVLVVMAVAVVGEAIIKVPPTMVKQRRPRTEILFDTTADTSIPLIIKCEADGQPAPRYRWIKNGRDFDWQTSDDRISQQPGKGTLVINPPRDDDAGAYQCLATNELGTATSAYLFVRKAELNNFKHEEPMTLEVQEGEPAMLPCDVPHGYPRPSVSWVIQDDDGPLRNINSSRMTVDPEGNLWFSNVTRSDESRNFSYSCSATSAFLYLYKLGNRVYLRVVQQTGSTAGHTERPPVYQFLSRKNSVILKGETLRLWCIYSGTPVPEIQWRKNDSTDFPHERVYYENYGKTLVIEDVDFEDEGTYECEANNGVGAARPYSMNVEVQATPYFVTEPEPVNKTEGETVELHCEASGRPPPLTRWTYNGQRITEETPFNSRRIVEPNRIVIHNLTVGDTGNYGCNATNEHGYVYTDVYINVLEDGLLIGQHEDVTGSRERQTSEDNTPSTGTTLINTSTSLWLLLVTVYTAATMSYRLLP